MLDSDLTLIKGIGPRRAERLASLGLCSLRDLLLLFPRKYKDYSHKASISQAEHGEYVAINLTEIGRPFYRRISRALEILSVQMSDGETKFRAVWFNQRYMLSHIPASPQGWYICGRVDCSKGLQLHEAFFSRNVPGIVPVYPQLKGFSQPVLRSLINNCIEYNAENNILRETLPNDLRRKYRLPGLAEAIRNLHSPECIDDANDAKCRFAFEDAAVFAMVLELLRRSRHKRQGISFSSLGLRQAFLELLPFTPTGSQLTVMDELEADMNKPHPMNRLIQGDVGSGKTMLAIYAMYIAVKNGYQAVLMAPTEILAEQHYTKLKEIFQDGAALISGGLKKSELAHTLDRVRSGSALAVVGTHALIENNIVFNRLGLVITDEQHRFGVKQRSSLERKSASPDIIIMSATPIPRTLALILYGDLEISVVKDKPPGRLDIITNYVPQSKRTAMYKYIEARIKRDGIQAYVVCPLIEEGDNATNARSVELVYAEISSTLDVKCALLHGKLKSDEKEHVMSAFRQGNLDILVSTTVIEVGVDVPNACIMVIEAADRFGLAQMHQLRGRVGRGGAESRCFLLSDSKSITARERIKALVENSDGFLIADMDLKLRGPGDILSAQQHGITGALVAMMSMDEETLLKARRFANEMIEANDPHAPLLANAVEKYKQFSQNLTSN